MDLGNIHLETPTGRSQMVSPPQHPKPSPIEFAILNDLCFIASSKLLIAREQEESLLNALRQIEGLFETIREVDASTNGSIDEDDIEHSIEGASRVGWARLAGRVATLQTWLHLTHRYQLLKVRELLDIKARMGAPMEEQQWRNFYLATEGLRYNAPNVHDLFLWRIDTQAGAIIETSSPTQNSTVLWRSSQ